jgi:hypothetical protein
MRSLPPFTGNAELDAWNQEVDQYLLNLQPQPIIDRGTGIITDPVDDSIQGFLERYLHVKYANDRIGTDFIDSPTNKLYYGLHNSDTSVESLDPVDYTWYSAGDAGFGPSNKLFFRNLGGRATDLFIGTVAPNYKWSEVLTTAIDLDDLLGAGTVGTDELADRSVTTIKIALNAVTVDELADDAVTLPKLNTTGTPGPNTVLNGEMEWITPQSGWFLDQTIIGDIITVTDAELGGHLYTDSGATDAIAVIDDDLAEIGSTMTFVNLAAINSFVTYPLGRIFLLNDATEEITLEIAPNGKAVLIKVETDRWVVDGTNLSTSALDPRFDYLITEVTLDFLETEDGRLITSEN